ncbi:hypothetical protein LSH36_270g00007 [Paralvinella palmiformis]|uniref:Cytoplasmic tRNA 2-thiolation protein 2 n=1 Tax=Paralvinella palmiformis TaxID=53620 RepID=A0AAD9JKW5_9ANNE|nr:hypothetical protein LSH36_270g00007 [Paralvinella palmiformis]
MRCAAFGKSKLVRDQEKVIAAYSGGHSSSAMVHLIQQGLSKRAQKKLRFIPSLVYIDEGAVIDKKVEERSSVIQNIIQLMRATELPYSIYILEQSSKVKEDDLVARSGFPTPIWDNNDPDEGEITGRLKMITSSDNTIQKLLASTKTLTAKQNIVNLLRLQLLASIAKQQGVTKVLLGNCATRLSVHLLSSIAQGQGAHLPYDISFADTRFKDIILIRPMREFTAKEVVMYNNLNDVKNIFIPNLSTKADSYSSIEQLTEMFVSGLQAEYPNTVSTIFRTGEKFDLSKSNSQSEQTCCMCHRPLDTDVGSSSALTATRFSLALCSKMADSQRGHKTADASTIAKSSGPSTESGQDSHRGHSTETVVFKVHRDIAEALGEGYMTALIMLDLTVAFDVTDHSIPRKRLEFSFRIREKALNLVKSYLTDGTQCVSVTDKIS